MSRGHWHSHLPPESLLLAFKVDGISSYQSAKYNAALGVLRNNYLSLQWVKEVRGSIFCALFVQPYQTSIYVSQPHQHPHRYRSFVQPWRIPAFLLGSFDSKSQRSVQLMKFTPHSISNILDKEATFWIQLARNRSSANWMCFSFCCCQITFTFCTGLDLLSQPVLFAIIFMVRLKGKKNHIYGLSSGGFAFPELWDFFSFLLSFFWFLCLELAWVVDSLSFCYCLWTPFLVVTVSLCPCGLPFFLLLFLCALGCLRPSLCRPPYA